MIHEQYVLISQLEVSWNHSVSMCLINVRSAGVGICLSSENIVVFELSTELFHSNQFSDFHYVQGDITAP